MIVRWFRCQCSGEYRNAHHAVIPKQLADGQGEEPLMAKATSRTVMRLSA